MAIMTILSWNVNGDSRSSGAMECDNHVVAATTRSLHSKKIICVNLRNLWFLVESPSLVDSVPLGVPILLHPIG